MRCADMHSQIKRFKAHSLHPFPLPQDQYPRQGMNGLQDDDIFRRKGAKVRLWLFRLYSKCKFLYENILQRLDDSSSFLQLIGFIILCVILRLILGRKAILLNIALAFLFYRVLARRSSKSGPYLKKLTHLQEDASASLHGKLNMQEEGEEFWHHKEGRSACFRRRRPLFKRREKKVVVEE